jgi:hypothetical protein
MNPQNKPIPKPRGEPSEIKVEPLKTDSIDEAARRTPQEKEHADYGGEHFDLKTPKKDRQH